MSRRKDLSLSGLFELASIAPKELGEFEMETQIRCMLREQINYSLEKVGHMQRTINQLAGKIEFITE